MENFIDIKKRKQITTTIMCYKLHVISENSSYKTSCDFRKLPLFSTYNLITKSRACNECTGKKKG